MAGASRLRPWRARLTYTEDTLLNLKTCFTWMGALLTAAVLAGCGGSGTDSGGTVRLVNATQGYGALDGYVTDVKQFSGIAESGASGYVGVGSGTLTFKLKLADSSTTALTQDLTPTSGTNYSLLAYNIGSKLSVAFLNDSQLAPTVGTAAFRVFNGATPAGAVDVYVTDSTTALTDVSPVASSVAAPGIGAYTEITKGTYRVRVTGAGDKNDLRLDIPAVTLSDQQIATLVLSSTSGGVLVNGLVLNQGGTATAFKNTTARVRVVAAVTGNGTVAASAGGLALGTALQAPSVGSYIVTPAALPKGSRRGTNHLIRPDTAPGTWRRVYVPSD